MIEQSKDMLGYCPVCGARGKKRECRMNGNDICEQGHTYPSRDALPQPEVQKDVE